MDTDDVNPPTSGTTSAKPPRPPNAWILYRSYKLKNLPPPTPGSLRPQSQVSKLVATMWRDEAPSVREYWELQADLRKSEHQRLYPNYRFQPMKKDEKDRIRLEKKAEKETARANGRRGRAARGAPYNRPPVSAAPDPDHAYKYQQPMFHVDSRVDVLATVDGSASPPLASSSSSSSEVDPLLLPLPASSESNSPASNGASSPAAIAPQFNSTHMPTGWQEPAAQTDSTNYSFDENGAGPSNYQDYNKAYETNGGTLPVDAFDFPPGTFNFAVPTEAGDFYDQDGGFANVAYANISLKGLGEGFFTVPDLDASTYTGGFEIDTAQLGNFDFPSEFLFDLNDGSSTVPGNDNYASYAELENNPLLNSISAFSYPPNTEEQQQPASSQETSVADSQLPSSQDTQVAPDSQQQQQQDMFNFVNMEGTRSFSQTFGPLDTIPQEDFSPEQQFSVDTPSSQFAPETPSHYVGESPAYTPSDYDFTATTPSTSYGGVGGGFSRQVSAQSNQSHRLPMSRQASSEQYQQPQESFQAPAPPPPAPTQHVYLHRSFAPVTAPLVVAATPSWPQPTTPAPGGNNHYRNRQAPQAPIQYTPPVEQQQVAQVQYQQPEQPQYASPQQEQSPQQYQNYASSQEHASQGQYQQDYVSSQGTQHQGVQESYHPTPTSSQEQGQEYSRQYAEYAGQQQQQPQSSYVPPSGAAKGGRRVGGSWRPPARLSR